MLSRSPCPFGVYQNAFALKTPAISAKLAVRANDAMARNYDANRIRSASPGDGAGAPWIAKRGGDFAVRLHFAARDGLQIFPDFELERGATDVEGYIQMDLFAAQVSEQRSNPEMKLLRIRRLHFRQLCGWIFTTQIFEQLGFRFA